jgi:drug/metabolite transporter (DMT)-like permease
VKKSYLPLLGISVCTLIWGSTWLAIKIGLETLPPFLFAGMRFTIAAVLLYGFMRIRGIPFPRDRTTWKVMLVLGFYQTLDYAFVFWGEQYIHSAMAAILFATMPFFVIICSYMMLDDRRTTWLKVLGISISFAGVIIIFMRDIGSARHSWLGDVAIILAAVCGAIFSVYAKKYANQINAVANTTVQMAFVAVFLSATGFLTENFSEIHFTGRGIGAIIYLGALGSAVAFGVYMWVIQRVNVVEAAIIPVATPIVAVFLGWLILDEHLTIYSLWGCGMILIGVYLVNILREEQLPWYKPAETGT